MFLHASYQLTVRSEISHLQFLSAKNMLQALSLFIAATLLMVEIHLIKIG